MNLQRKLTLVLTTGAIALGAGHYVQEKARARAAADLPSVKVTDVKPVAAGREEVAPRTAAILPSVLPGEAAPFIAPTVTEPSTAVLAAADPVADVPDGLQPAPSPMMDAGPDCAMKFDLVPQAFALIGISLLAPCHPEQRIVLKHAGLAVTARTSASGALLTTLPALTAVAEVEATFSSGEKARASLPMPDFVEIVRFAVQWQDKDAFQLHAFENGAGYDQPGHISSAFTGTAGESGLITVLGDASVDLPLLAEVYTFGPGKKADLVLEAAITEATCGREILGETIFAVGGSVEISDLTLAMPECDAVGDILVLKNLLQTMTLAVVN